MTDDARKKKIRFLVKRRYGDITRFDGLKLDLALEAARKRSPSEASGRTQHQALVDALTNVTGRRGKTHDDDTLQKIAEYIALLERLDGANLDQIFEETRPRGLFGLLAPDDALTEHEQFIEVTFGSADFAHWASLPHWTSEEAVHLSLGVEPGFVPRPGFDYKGDPKSTHAFARRRAIVSRAVNAGTLPNPITPSAFVGWSRQWSVDIPTELVDAVLSVKAHHEAVGSSPATPELAADDAAPQEVIAELSTRERETYQKILIGMAVGGYSYKPDAPRSDVPKEIAADIGAIELSVSDETIRKKLRESTGLLGGNVRNRLRP